METIIKIIQEFKPTCAIGANTKLLEENILDSLLMLMLVSNLNEKFDIVITAKDITPENFATVVDIYNLVERLQNEER